MGRIDCRVFNQPSIQFRILSTVSANGNGTNEKLIELVVNTAETSDILTFDIEHAKWMLRALIHCIDKLEDKLEDKSHG